MDINSTVLQASLLCLRQPILMIFVKTKAKVGNLTFTHFTQPVDSK
jgi:hypothetical protein